MPSKREALTVTVIMALFLLLTSIFIGLRSEHLLMAVLYLVLFFAGLPTRKLASGYSLRILRCTQLADSGRFCRNLLPLLGSRSHPVRSLPVFQERKKNLPSLCVSILVCQFDWFCRLLYSSGRSALVCHQLRFRTDIKHTG